MKKYFKTALFLLLLSVFLFIAAPLVFLSDVETPIKFLFYILPIMLVGVSSIILASVLKDYDMWKNKEAYEKSITEIEELRTTYSSMINKLLNKINNE